ncbi:MAG: fibronectin type III domain-containing protein [Planctomycetota bacterium]
MNLKMIYVLITFIALLQLLLLFIGCGGENPIIEETLRVSDVTISVQGDKALIRWQTDVAADSKVEYGITKSYGAVAFESTLKTQHAIELTGLQFQTTYHFRVQSIDELGQEAQKGNLTFATLTDSQKIAPQPFEVQVFARPDQVTITWQTNESARGEIEYGEDTSYGIVTEGREAQLNHDVILTGLESETTYHYRIRVTDLDGNVFTSDDLTFKTEAQPKESTSRINLTARQWQFSPATIRVAKGDKVILTLQSVDVAHGFGLSAFRINENLNPGKEVTVEFTANKKGEYTFVCTIACGAGHGDMTGKLIVE